MKIRSCAAHLITIVAAIQPMTVAARDAVPAFELGVYGGGALNTSWFDEGGGIGPVPTFGAEATFWTSPTAGLDPAASAPTPVPAQGLVQIPDGTPLPIGHLLMSHTNGDRILLETDVSTKAVFLRNSLTPLQLDGGRLLIVHENGPTNASAFLVRLPGAGSVLSVRSGAAEVDAQDGAVKVTAHSGTIQWFDSRTGALLGGEVPRGDGTYTSSTSIAPPIEIPVGASAEILTGPDNQPVVNIVHATPISSEALSSFAGGMIGVELIGAYVKPVSQPLQVQLSAIMAEMTACSQSSGGCTPEQVWEIASGSGGCTQASPACTREEVFEIAAGLQGCSEGGRVCTQAQTLEIANMLVSPALRLGRADGPPAPAAEPNVRTSRDFAAYDAALPLYMRPRGPRQPDVPTGTTGFGGEGESPLAIAAAILLTDADGNSIYGNYDELGRPAQFPSLCSGGSTGAGLCGGSADIFSSIATVAAGPTGTTGTVPGGTSSVVPPPVVTSPVVTPPVVTTPVVTTPVLVPPVVTPPVVTTTLQSANNVQFAASARNTITADANLWGVSVLPGQRIEFVTRNATTKLIDQIIIGDTHEPGSINPSLVRLTRESGNHFGNPVLSHGLNSGRHIAFGAPVPAGTFPTTGTFTYNFVATTAPTYGRTDGVIAPGTLTGSAAVDFATLKLGVAMTATMPNQTYTIQTPGGTASPASSTVLISSPAAGSGQHFHFGSGGYTTSAVTCAVACPTRIIGHFYGAGAAFTSILFQADIPGNSVSLNGAAIGQKQ